MQALGPLRLWVDGSQVPLAGAVQRRVLAALALHADHDLGSDRLAELVWGDDLPADVPNAIQTHVRRLRVALGPAAERLVTAPPGYRLELGTGLDVVAFRAEARHGHDLATRDPHAAIPVLDTALARWHGEPWLDLDHPDAVADSAGLADVEVTGREDRAAAALAVGDHADAIERTARLRTQHPLRERPVDLAMRSLAAAGRVGDALAAYRSHHQVLVDELGLEPSSALQELHRRVLVRDHDVAPDPAPVTTPRPDPDPVRRADELGNTLPVRPSSLLGRERDLAVVHRALADGPLVTVVGPGGVGKTRLALEIVHTTTGSAWWCDLAAVGPDRLLAALTTTMAIDTGPDVSPRRLAAMLSGHRGVLCLDNGEHLLDDLAAVVEALADGAPHLSVLLTTRERLALDAEVLHRLAPLPPPAGADRDNPGVRLFLRRWSPTVTDHDDVRVAQVADVCRRLDGMPLAIELAAARASVLGLPAVATRLDDRLDLLAGGRRTGDERHQTLRRVLDWSHDLLDASEARLYARLSVFPGTFTLEQAEAVCAEEHPHGSDDGPDGGPGDGGEGDATREAARRAVSACLARLVEQSLVQRGADGRFRLLETMRVHAAERLTPAEARHLADRHAADVVARLASESSRLWGPDEPDAVHALNAGIDDLHAAWAHASRTDRALAAEMAAEVFWFAYFRQRLELLDWATTVAGWELPHPRRPTVLAAAAVAAWSAGRMDRAQDLVDEAIALAGGPSAPGAELAVDIGADLAMFRGDTAAAVEAYRLVGEHHRGDGASAGLRLSAEVALAQARAYVEDDVDVRDHLDELARRADDVGCPTVRAFAGFVIGEAWARVDVDRSRAGYEDAVDHGRRADCRLFVNFAQSSIVALLAASGTIEEATTAFRRTLEHWEQVGNVAGQWTVLGSLVVLLVRRGDDEVALRILGAVDEASRDGRWRNPNPHVVDEARAAAVARQGEDRGDCHLRAGAADSLDGVLVLARRAVTST